MADAELTHQGEVIGKTMIVIARDRGRVCADDRTGLRGKTVPDGFTLSINCGGAFDLRGCGRDAPNEIERELIRMIRHAELDEEMDA